MKPEMSVHQEQRQGKRKGQGGPEDASGASKQAAWWPQWDPQRRGPSIDTYDPCKEFEFQPLGDDKGKEKKGEGEEKWNIRTNLHQRIPPQFAVDEYVWDPARYLDVFTSSSLKPIHVK